MIGRGRGGQVAALAACLVAMGSPVANGTGLEVDGMTFVSSRESDNEVVLRAERAVYDSETDRAGLEQVRAEVKSVDDGTLSFSVRCDAGELDLDTNDFIARGNVSGETETGERFQTAWVRYEHEEGLLATEAPVTIIAESGTYRGGGFRYLTRERRFKLLGGASVVQEP